MDEHQATSTPRSDRRSAPSEEAVLFPTFGHLTPDGRHWQVGVSGVIFARRSPNLQRKMFTRVLQRLMRVSKGELQGELFQRRVERFLVKTLHRRQLSVEVGGAQHPLQRRSKRSGHFRGSFRLSLDEARRLARSRDFDNQWLDFRIAGLNGAVRESPGRAQLIGQSGVTVISDIDDTIKLSEVADRRRLLQNTFLREFQPVPGMAEVFQSWAAQGAVFHYVSSSPWQLYPCLQELLDQSGFPAGSLHLRTIRLRDAGAMRLFAARRATKRRVIRSIVSMFPYRQFVLVGDSGEKDPEIYGGIARRFPRQVKRIQIRLVEGGPTDPARFRRALREVDVSRYRIFDHAEQLLGQPLLE